MTFNAVLNTLWDHLIIDLAHLCHTLFDLGSVFSIASLCSAATIAFVYYAYRTRHVKSRRLSLILRLIWPKKLFLSLSSRSDFAFFLVNLYVTGALIGWAVIAKGGVSHWVANSLLNIGIVPVHIAPAVAMIMVTIIIFIVYDFGYWLDHVLMHKISWLWPFHRVHHTAEVRTPLTQFRVHPIDTLIFANIEAILIGTAEGILHSYLGSSYSEFTVDSTNILLFIFVFTTVHLQHSHVRISFSGIWGELFFSPMHHQIHHSQNPIHYGHNMGSCLAIWDKMFGTLYHPKDLTSPLSYGADPEGENPHSMVGGLLHPFALCFKAISTDFETSETFGKLTKIKTLFSNTRQISSRL